MCSTKVARAIAQPVIFDTSSDDEISAVQFVSSGIGLPPIHHVTFAVAP